LLFLLNSACLAENQQLTILTRVVSLKIDPLYSSFNDSSCTIDIKMVRHCLLVQLNVISKNGNQWFYTLLKQGKHKTTNMMLIIITRYWCGDALLCFGFVSFRFHFVDFVSFRFRWFRFVSFRFVSISFRTLQNAKFISITCDGCADFTGDDFESVYVRHCTNGVVFDQFLHIGLPSNYFSQCGSSIVIQVWCSDI
jgi:hypothetical protein